MSEKIFSEAFSGEAYPIIGKLNDDGTYSDGFACGEAVSTSITTNYTEGSLFGDNRQVKYVRKFSNAAINLGSTRFPIQAASTMFGHEVDAETGKVVYNSNDKANYVGFGFLATTETEECIAKLLYKVKLTESAQSHATAGDSISFATPSCEGQAVTLDNGDWMESVPFTSESEALAFLKTTLGAAYSVTQTLSNAESSYKDSIVDRKKAFEATITAKTGYTLGTVTVTMGGTDISSTAWNSGTGKVSISEVTGPVVITVATTAIPNGSTSPIGG